MRRAATVVVLAVGFAATGSAGAAPPVQPVDGTPTAGSLSAALSTAKAKAKPVAWTLKLHTNLVCGQPGSIVVAFPAGASVPTTVMPAAVMVNGKPAAKVGVAAHQVTVTAVRPGGVLCDVIAPGFVTLRFTRLAALGNPASPGTYMVTVQHLRSTYRAAVHISA